VSVVLVVPHYANDDTGTMEDTGEDSRAGLLDRILNEELPRYADALERLGRQK
jgi:hypothetical protein